MTEQDAIAAMEALESQNAAKTREVQMAMAMAADKTIASDTDTTFAGNVTATTGTSSNKSSSAPKKKGPKTKLTAKEKKERSVSFLRMAMWT
jgi:DASH complex subunit DAM1